MIHEAFAFIDKAFALLDRAQPYLTLTLLLIAVVALAANVILNRNMPRIGGKIGRRSAGAPAVPVPDGFSRVDCREITKFVAADDAEPYASFKAFAREAVVHRPGQVYVYRVAGLQTRIEIPAEPPAYQRIDATEALALLRELPDPRLVHRLHLSDEAAVLDPWVRKVIGRDFYSLGHATLADLVVLYRPDRQLGRELGITLLHEWLHLVAFNSAKLVRRFRRADKIETLPPLAYPQLPFANSIRPVYEAWCELGEKILGYDETLARQAALASPVHTMILWRQIEKILRKTPQRLASTRLDEFKARGAFMRLEVAPKARAVRAGHRWWRRWRAKTPP
jgi:hypothetical protein